MNTIMILAQAIAKAARAEVTRLDIQYNEKTEEYSGQLWISTNNTVFDIHENGEIHLEDRR